VKGGFFPLLGAGGGRVRHLDGRLTRNDVRGLNVVGRGGLNVLLKNQNRQATERGNRTCRLLCSGGHEGGGA